MTGHPVGLRVLFGTEAWERFCYYGMRAILMFYMTKSLLIGDADAAKIYGLFTGLVYLTPLIGGYIADRWIGQRKSIVIGSILMSAGYFGMMIHSKEVFYCALGLAIVGNGFFKSNISTIVGQLYDKDEDERRGRAYMYFYQGINLGALFSPLVCGTLGERVGWHYGFMAAGIGMLVALAIFLYGQRYLGDKGIKPLARPSVDNPQASKPLNDTEKDRLVAIFVLVFFSIFFWSVFEQAGSSLNFFADRATDRTVPILGKAFPASWYQTVNPLIIVLLGAFIPSFWKFLEKHGFNPTIPTRMGIGLLLASLGFVIMVLAADSYETGNKALVSPFWLVGCYFVTTIGELFISPVGLDLISKLSPVKFTSILMGVWFGAVCVANYLGGYFASFYGNIPLTKLFAIPVCTAGGAGIILIAISRFIHRKMHV